MALSQQLTRQRCGRYSEAEIFRSPDEIRGALPATSRDYDCMDAGGSAKQDARAESICHRHIHRHVGGASAAKLSIASSPNSHRKRWMRKASSTLAAAQAQCWSKKKRSSEYSGLLEHSDKAMIGRDFSCEAKRDSAELDRRFYYRISTAVYLITVSFDIKD